MYAATPDDGRGSGLGPRFFIAVLTRNFFGGLFRMFKRGYRFGVSGAGSAG